MIAISATLISGTIGGPRCGADASYHFRAPFSRDSGCTCLPVVSPPSQPTAEDAGRVGTVKGGKAMRFTHRGPYAGLMGTYGRIIEFLKARDLMQSEDDWMRYMPMWEEYLNDPQTTPETDLLTYIYLPVT
jgi:DNA gyrase inhibitor GyrI